MALIYAWDPPTPCHPFQSANNAISSSLVLWIQQPPSCLLAQILFPLIPSVPCWQRDLSTQRSTVPNPGLPSQDLHGLTPNLYSYWIAHCSPWSTLHHSPPEFLPFPGTIPGSSRLSSLTPFPPSGRYNVYITKFLDPTEIYLHHCIYYENFSELAPYEEKENNDGIKVAQAIWYSMIITTANICRPFPMFQKSANDEWASSCTLTIQIVPNRYYHYPTPTHIWETRAQKLVTYPVSDS